LAKLPAIGLERHPEKVDRSQAGRIGAIPREAFLGAPGHALPERLLWRMLYGPLPGPRVLLLDVEDLDVANKRGVVIGKGGNAEPIGWVGDGHRPIAPSLPHRAEGRTAVPLEFGPACSSGAEAARCRRLRLQRLPPLRHHLGQLAPHESRPARAQGGPYERLMTMLTVQLPESLLREAMGE
jgi:hypothetical protein